MQSLSEASILESLSQQPEIPCHLNSRPDRVRPPSKDEAFKAEVKAFTEAMEAYKQRSGRKFPTWSETLEVLRSLGYEKSSES